MPIIDPLKKNYMVSLIFDQLVISYLFMNMTKREIIHELDSMQVGEACTDITFAEASPYQDREYILNLGVRRTMCDCTEE